MPTQKRWMKVPPKPARPKIPDDLKLEVQKNADQFLESFLKPNFILPPPEDPKFNYIYKFHPLYQDVGVVSRKKIGKM